MALINYKVTLVAKQDSPFNVLPDTDISIRKVSDNALVNIFSDAAGLVPIPQLGAKSDTLGQFSFYTDSAVEVKAVWSDGVSSYSEPFRGNSLQALSGLTEPSELAQRHRIKTTVAEVATGVFNTGDLLEVVDRGGAKFKVGTDTENTFNIINAGAGKSATLQTTGDVKVIEWGAVGDNIANDTLPIRAAINYVRSISFGSVDFGSGYIFRVLESIQGAHNCRYKGSSTILADAGFTGVTLLNAAAADAPTVIKSIFYFVEGGRINDPVAPRRTGVFFESSLKLNGSSNVNFGIYADSYPACTYDCEILNVTETSIRLNALCWNNKIRGYLHGFGEAPVFTGSGCNGMDFSGMFAWGDPFLPNFGFIVEGDNNAYCINGGTIEKVGIGVQLQKGAGPILIAGVDFEGITTSVVNLDGTATPSRVTGVATLKNSYLESDSITAPIMAVENGVGTIEGCRIKRGAKIATASGNTNSYVHIKNCINNLNIPIGDGNIIHEEMKDSNYKFIYQLPNASGTFKRTYEVENRSSSFDSSLATSGIFFESAVQDTPTQFDVSYGEMFATVVNGGIVTAKWGLAINGKAGTKRVTPLADNDTKFGDASLRWSEVYSANGTINTSDERLKTPLQDLSAAELAVAKEVKSLIKKYKMLDSIERKGADNARIHFGVGAQSVISAFERHGLNAFDYSLVCLDSWDDQLKHYEAVLSEDEEEVSAAYSEVEIPAGSRYGIRYEQLLCFLIAAL